MPTATPSGPVVVTGGAGAVGSNLVRALLARGVRVRVVDNLSSGRREHLPPPDGDRLTLLVADLKHPDEYASALEGVSAVWHLAANTDIRKAIEGPRLDLEDGTVASAMLLEEMRRHDVPAIRFSSSSVIYGWAKTLPTPEEYGPLEPQSLYAASKLAVEGLVCAYAYSYGVQAHMFRFANIIGPGMTHGILFDFFDKLERDPTRLEVLGDGRQSKSYLRTEDCVDGMLLAAERATERVNTFNLGTRDRTSVRQIAEKVVAAHGGRARIDYTGGERGWVGDVPVQLLAIERMKRLGWEPRYSSDQAIDRTISEIQAARAGARPSP
jgi:UDP-glucose 4-epimerase